MNVVQQDDSLPHQIRLYSASSKGRVHVSCNCTGKRHATGGTLTYVSFGVPRNTREAKALYNDLTKHDQSKHPFTVEHLLEEK